ncbi:MAG: hypothetical protein PWP23_2067 [Candidatus Sumerlaeota bacterium]|nr:hypothetical protein [Candidatus Sumerlaeota bacterium]
MKCSADQRATWWWRFGLTAGLLLLAWLQLGPLVHERPGEGAWFLFGNDTVSHDVPVQLWVWQAFLDSGARLPLWMPPLKGGLPTLGAFLWTPFAPSLWLHAVLPFPLAQRLQFVWALWWAGLGGFWLARGTGCRRETALLAAVACCLSGHVVTLIHAGHLQKILALAWLPWFAGGIVRAFGAENDAARVVRGSAAAGIALGMAFLSGHPQIAYTMLGLLGLRVVWAMPRGGFRHVSPAVAIVAVGLLAGGAQLLPGSEMAAWSNRSGGVAFAEAVDTSYPPLEIFEFALPRFLGDSSPVGSGRYFGQWGERLVSDYAGVLVVVLAFAAFCGRAQRREAAYWWSAALVFLFIGFGHYTPFYKLLYHVMPGMDRFRSPGTFFAGVAVALPVLGALGLESAMVLLERKRAPLFLIAGAVFGIIGVVGWMMTRNAEVGAWPFAMHAAARSAGLLALGAFALTLFAWRQCAGAAAGIVLSLLVSGDLLAANSAFLVAVPWTHYQAGYVAPNALDVAMADEAAPRRVFEPGRELSLRPILNGRDALLAYHPISFAAYEEQLHRLTFGTPEWRAAWGVTHVWMPGPADAAAPEGAVVAARFHGQPGGVLLRDPTVPGAVRSADGTPLSEWSWTERLPNREVLAVEMPENGTLEVAESIVPGWRWRVDGEAWSTAKDVSLVRHVALSPGAHVVEWEYRPRSYALGLYATALGFCLAGFGGAAARRRKKVTSPGQQNDDTALRSGKPAANVKEASVKEEGNS